LVGGHLSGRKERVPKGLQDLYPHSPARGACARHRCPWSASPGDPRKRPGPPATGRPPALTNPKNGPRRLADVLELRGRAEDGAWWPPSGEATREVSGDATAAGLEPDRVFYAGAVQWHRRRQDQLGPPGRARRMHTPTRDIGRRCPSYGLRPRSKNDAAPEPRVPAAPRRRQGQARQRRAARRRRAHRAPRQQLHWAGSRHRVRGGIQCRNRRRPRR
jgi:hypothetical protein